jgi:hypothetical protein
MRINLKGADRDSLSTKKHRCRSRVQGYKDDSTDNKLVFQLSLHTIPTRIRKEIRKISMHRISFIPHTKTCQSRMFFKFPFSAPPSPFSYRSQSQFRCHGVFRNQNQMRSKEKEQKKKKETEALPLFSSTPQPSHAAKKRLPKMRVRFPPASLAPSRNREGKKSVSKRGERGNQIAKRNIKRLLCNEEKVKGVLQPIPETPAKSNGKQTVKQKDESRAEKKKIREKAYADDVLRPMSS